MLMIENIATMPVTAPSEGIQAQIAQVRGHVARAAAEVGDRAVPGRLHEFGEGAKQRPVRQPVRDAAADLQGEVSGHGVVRGPGRAQCGGFGHGRAP
jgi:hypothetical protein